MKNFVQLETNHSFEFLVSDIIEKTGYDRTCFAPAGTDIINVDTLLPAMKFIGYRLVNVSSAADSGYISHFFNFILDK